MATHGAVSEPVARTMAQAARGLGADFGIGITGIAGPTGATPEKPVGTVHLALVGRGADRSSPEVSAMVHRCVRFPGDREMVRQQACQLALDLLRRALAVAAQPAAVSDRGEAG